MDLYGPDFSDSRDPIFSDSGEPMIIFSDSRDPIFNSRDPNGVPKTPKKTCLYIKYFPGNYMLMKCLGRENVELFFRVAPKITCGPLH